MDIRSGDLDTFVHRVRPLVFQTGSDGKEPCGRNLKAGEKPVHGKHGERTKDVLAGVPVVENAIPTLRAAFAVLNWNYDDPCTAKERK